MRTIKNYLIAMAIAFTMIAVTDMFIFSPDALTDQQRREQGQVRIAFQYI